MPLPAPSPRAPRLYLRPLGLFFGDEAEAVLRVGQGLPLGGPARACALVEATLWAPPEPPDRRILRPRQIESWLAALPPELRCRARRLLDRLTGGNLLPRPQVMGILNVTPDSFSDGGRHAGAEAAVQAGLRMAADGADLIDVGGESTRPGAAPVPPGEELRRVLPVIEGLAGAGLRVSVDTRRAAVMEAAVAAGAWMINDVSGLAHDPRSLAVAAASGAKVVLMHMQGTPATMNEAPAYEQCALEVFDRLEARLEACEAAGLPRGRVIVDPGLCFGKHEPHNVDLLRHLAMLLGLGCPLMLGVSRKGWAEWIERRHPPADRLPSTLAGNQWALAMGAGLLRVHDVAAARQAVDAWCTIGGHNPTGP
ncbi:dihydropteroate synthase [Geminicoccaceae bacterium 1502E]|nr:dihydropteroate synthase [Geminicoccaceae bacterium 1502E]